MNFSEKVILLNDLSDWRKAFRAGRKSLVVTNGCFDVIHLGHVTYLEAARNHGDALLVGVNSDEAIRQLKGPERPVNIVGDRVRVLAALESVTAVCVFPEQTAARFLEISQPDIYVKGGDYDIDRLPIEEKNMVRKCGGKIVIVQLVPGRSTTATLHKISRL